MLNRIVKVEWSDASTFHTNVWRTLEEVNELEKANVVTTGLLAIVDEERVVIVSTFQVDKDDNLLMCTGEFVFSPSAIKKITVLE
jgi:hypothetical protein